MDAVNALQWRQIADAALWNGAAPLLEDTPLIDVDALIAGAHRAVIVAPHPLDEVLGSGGLIAEFAFAGLDTLIVGVTDGEASHPGSRAWTREALRAKRIEESTQALHVLGADLDNVVRLHLPHGGLRDETETLRHRIGALLRPGDVVVTAWQDGDQDHIACQDAVARAVFRRPLATRDAPIWMWSWADPGDAALPWPCVTRVALGSEAQQRKRHALQLFGSQLRTDPDVAGTPLLDAARLERFTRPFEMLIDAAQF